MATVRISERLTNSIMSNARRIFAQQIDRIGQTLELGEAETVYEKVMHDYLPIASKLPVGFLRGIREFSVRYGTPADEVSIYVKLTSERPWFHTGIPSSDFFKVNSNSYNSYTAVFIQDKAFEPTGDEHWDNVSAIIKNKIDSITATREREKTFLKGLGLLMTKHSTLAPMLKEFPPLWDLIPSDVKETHKTIVKRGKKETEATTEETIDLSSMTATVIASKLGV
jgi:hypothetical protein